LTAQAPFDLCHKAFRQSQGIEGLVEGLGRVLCLTAVSRETLLCFEAATLSGFRVFFDGSCSRSHHPLLGSMGVFGGGSLPKRL
jgi:hypothetical protein